jgi:hypothetical protein
VLVEQLFEVARKHGTTEETVYLDSNVLDHRWGADSFQDLTEEFKYKAIWVAKRMREVLGSPDPSAFVQALHRFEPGLLAAAWWMHGRIAFVCLRHSVNPHGSALSRQRLTVVLGVTEPGPDEPGASGDEARVAAGIVGYLIH